MDLGFTLELHGLHSELGKVGYRLQLDQRWRRLGDRPVLATSDYRTESPADISALSPKAGTSIAIDGVDFQINPRSVQMCSSVLEFGARCFRRTFPAVPSKAQLHKALAAWDEGLSAVLVLRVDSQFAFWNASSFDTDLNDPSVAVRHETFLAGSGRAGHRAADDDDHVEALYTLSLEGWVFHLKDGWTQIHAGLPGGRISRNPVKDLAILSRNWRPGWWSPCQGQVT